MTTMNLKGALARSVPGLSADDFVDLTWRDGTAALSGIPSGSFGTKILTRGPGHGIFGGWHWDGTTLTAEVDRYGFFSMFYAAREGRILVSPSLWQLAARGADLTPDRRALAVFHRLGIFINDDTPFAGIRVLPPCGKLRWTRGKLTIDAPARRITPQQISPNDAVDGMIELFRRAIERTLRTWSGPIILPLSGGRDSRHILLELVRQGRPPEACVTFHHGGARWNTEVKAARALCEAVGVRHIVLGHPRSRQVDHLRAIALTQLCADEHAQMMPLHDYLLDHREAAAFDGIAGDILTNPDDDAEAYFQLAGAGNFAEIARRMITGHGAVISRAANGTGAGPLYSPGADDATVAYVADAIAAYADAPDPYQMFWLMHRTRREISFVANGILSPAQAVFTPYLDTDFVEFCTSLPYAVTRSQTLHDEAIHRAYPAYADVPFAEAYRPDPPGASSLRHKFRSLADTARIARFLAPEAPISTFTALMGRRSPLHAQANAMYLMHDRLVDGLTPDGAKALVGFAEHLEATRPRALVTDSFAPPSRARMPQTGANGWMEAMGLRVGSE